MTIQFSFKLLRDHIYKNNLNLKNAHLSLIDKVMMVKVLIK